MLDETVNHVEQTWKHVLHGKSTLEEKIEFGAEATVGLIGAVALGRLRGLSRSTVSESLPKLVLTEAERPLLSHEATAATSSKGVAWSRDGLAEREPISNLDKVGMLSNRPETTTIKIDVADLFKQTEAKGETAVTKLTAPADLKPDTPAASMFPKSYKVLTLDGASPWRKELKWSLPEQSKDGEWIPGQWQELRRAGSAAPDDLYISSDPHSWLNWAESRNGVLYEVQIGDAESAARWTNAYNHDFTVKQLRLLRPISKEELKTLQSPVLTEQGTKEAANRPWSLASSMQPASSNNPRIAEWAKRMEDYMKSNTTP